MDFHAFKEYVCRGPSSFSNAEMQDLFDSLKVEQNDHVTEDQFVHVFATMTSNLKDTEFQLFVEELTV